MAPTASTPTTQEDNSLNSVEEGIPAAPSSRKAVTNRSLSKVSRMYDVDGDGKLDAAEQAMRDMDSQNLGYLPNDKVYTIFQEQLRMQKQLLLAKRIIIFCAVFLIILAAANVGVSFAAANLAKDTSTQQNVLVVKETGEVVATNNHADVFRVSTFMDNARRTEFTADGTTTAQEETTISKQNVQTMFSDCTGDGSAQIARSWAGWETVAALNVNIPVCPGKTVTGMPNGNTFSFTLSDSRKIDIDCQNSDTCVMTGSGIQQLAGDACVYDSDCLYMATCVGVNVATKTPGKCILPMYGSGCEYANGGSDCETNYCFFGGFTPPNFGLCTCHPTSNSGCDGAWQCYTGSERGYPDSNPMCLLPVGESGCTQDYECFGNNVSCVAGICAQQ